MKTKKIVIFVLKSGLNDRKLASIWETGNSRHYGKKDTTAKKQLDRTYLIENTVTNKKTGEEADVILCFIENKHLRSKKMQKIISSIDPNVPRENTILVGRENLVEKLFGEWKGYGGRYHNGREDVLCGWIVGADSRNPGTALPDSKLTDLMEELILTFVIGYDFEKSQGRLKTSPNGLLS